MKCFLMPNISSTAGADDRDFSLSCLEAALEGGADWLVLCDTNGGVLPERIVETIHEVRQALPEAQTRNSSPQRHRNRRRRKPCRTYRRCQTNPRHLQRIRRTLRQCKPNLAHRLAVTKNTMANTRNTRTLAETQRSLRASKRTSR